jgi:hypothetical protein
VGSDRQPRRKHSSLPSARLLPLQLEVCEEVCRSLFHVNLSVTVFSGETQYVLLVRHILFADVFFCLTSLHFLVVFLNFLLDVICLLVIKPLHQLVSELETALLWLLILGELARVHFPGFFDLRPQLGVVKLVLICLPGLHELRNRV